MYGLFFKAKVWIGTLACSLFIWSSEINAQGETCGAAVSIIAGSHTANGPATGGGATNTCHNEGSPTNADWYSYTPGSSGMITIESCSSSGNPPDTRISVYDGTCGSLNSIGCDDDTCPGINSSTLTVNVTGGTTYLLDWDDRWSITGFDWTLSLAPLPVELIHFNGELHRKGNLLKWITASEIGTSHFVVERSSTMEGGWIPIGEVEAVGNDHFETNYKFLDERPLPESYYRLVAVDHDRSEEISQVIALERKDAGFTMHSAYPNPTSDHLFVLFHSDENTEVQVSVTDMSGRLVRSSNFSAADGMNQLPLDLEAIPEGTYLIELNDGFSRIVERIVKH